MRGVPQVYYGPWGACNIPAFRDHIGATTVSHLYEIDGNAEDNRHRSLK